MELNFKRNGFLLAYELLYYESEIYFWFIPFPQWANAFRQLTNLRSFYYVPKSKILKILFTFSVALHFVLIDHLV